MFLSFLLLAAECVPDCPTDSSSDHALFHNGTLSYVLSLRHIFPVKHMVIDSLSTRKAPCLPLKRKYIALSVCFSLLFFEKKHFRILKIKVKR